MVGEKSYRIGSISEFHEIIGLPRPQHPLISVVDLKDVKRPADQMPATRILEFYTISIKRYNIGFKYGQQRYDVQDGVMYFIGPGQVFTPPIKNKEAKVNSISGWALYIHPDFFWNTHLAKAIKRYEYFSYSVNEALYLSGSEEAIIVSLMQSIQREYFTNTDKFSHDIIISIVETLLNFADRFYYRQFLTQKVENHQILERLEHLLNTYFDSPDLIVSGLPTVQTIAEKLNISPNYLGSLLKALTGRNTQQHIQDKLIEKAKEKISSKQLSLSEISYELGFEYPQSFTRLFKAKTGLTPLAFRQALS
jgi:AraC-like DNA-binding protein